MVNQVHGRFLQRYLTPWQETEGGIVEIPADLRQVAPSSQNQNLNDKEPNEPLSDEVSLPSSDVMDPLETSAVPGSIQNPVSPAVSSRPSKIPCRVAWRYSAQIQNHRRPLKLFSSPK